MFFDHYPYTNFHNVNLDWILQAVKAWGQTVETNDRAFRDLQEANEDFKEYVTNYLQDLDVSDEINSKLDEMLASGVLTPYFAPYVQGYVDSWLSSHVTPTSPALDNTLTLSGAAARSDTVGSRLKDAAYTGTISQPAEYAMLKREDVVPGYRINAVAYDYNGNFYVCGGSTAANGTGMIAKMTNLDFSDAVITEIAQLGHANDITYYDGNLYVCTANNSGVAEGNAPLNQIWRINANDFTDKTLITNCPSNTIGIAYRQGDFWILAPYQIYRTTDFTTYEIIVDNTNTLMTSYGIPTEGRLSQSLFRAAGYLMGWCCAFVHDGQHYGAITYFASTGQPVDFDMFPCLGAEFQGAVYADMSLWMVTDGNMVNILRADPRHLYYTMLDGHDLDRLTAAGKYYSTGASVSAGLVNSPVTDEGFTLTVARLGLYNVQQTIESNSGRHLTRRLSFETWEWSAWEDLGANLSSVNAVNLSWGMGSTGAFNGVTYTRTGPDTWTVSGTATNASYRTVVSAVDGFISGMAPGGTYMLHFESSDPGVTVRLYPYYNGSVGSLLMEVPGDTIFTVPADASGINIRLFVARNRTVNSTVTIQVLNARSNAALTAAATPYLHNIAFFGDSIMLGRDGSTAAGYVDYTIPWHVAYKLNAAYTNQAVGGMGYLRPSDSGNQIAYDKIHATNLDKYDVVVLAFGTNDGFYPIGTYDSTDLTTCLGQFNRIISDIYTRYPDMQVVVLAPFNGSNAGSFPAYWYGTPGGSAYSRQSLSDALKAACNRYWIPYIEQYDGPINAYTITQALPDGVHPDAEYHARIGSWLAGKLRDIL